MAETLTSFYLLEQGVCTTRGFLGLKVMILPDFLCSNIKENVIEKNVKRASCLALPTHRGIWRNETVVRINESGNYTAFQGGPSVFYVMSSAILLTSFLLLYTFCKAYNDFPGLSHRTLHFTLVMKLYNL